MGKVLQIIGITGSVLTVFGIIAYLSHPGKWTTFSSRSIWGSDYSSF